MTLTREDDYFFDQLGEGVLSANEFRFQFTNFLKQSKRDFNPKFGQFLTFENFTTPYGADFSGGLTAVRLGLYFPGFWKHHSIFLKSGLQNRNITLDNDNYWFSNRIEIPRGFGSVVYENYLFGAVNYALPIWYPDLALGPILNIQRIRLNGFFDLARGSSDVRNGQNGRTRINEIQYYSWGFETRFDINLMRLITPFDLGIRVAFKNDPFDAGEDPVSIEFLFGLFTF